MRQWRITVMSVGAVITVLGMALIVSALVAQSRVSKKVDAIETKIERGMSELSAMLDTAESLATTVMVNQSHERTNASTQLQVNLYDNKGNLLESQLSMLPAYLLDVERTVVERFFDHVYEGFEEYSGVYQVKDAKVVAFSPELVEVSKTVEQITEGYYVHVVNDMIVVYYADMETVFEATGISILSLPEEDQIRLRQGIFVDTKEEVFSILEAYTS